MRAVGRIAVSIARMKEHPGITDLAYVTTDADCYGGRVAVLWMHPVDEQKRLGISSALLDFEPGTQEARAEKKAPRP